jgi:hypothetical protein
MARGERGDLDQLSGTPEAHGCRRPGSGYKRGMGKADRLERLDMLRAEMEVEYEAALVAALRRAAAGSWGLFDHQQDRNARAKWAPAVTQLCDMGRDIDRMRDTLGLEPFPLHAEFEASRGRVPSTAPGEPKQARAWLEKMGKSLQPE